MSQQLNDRVVEREEVLDKMLLDIEAAQSDPDLLAALTRVVRTALAIKMAIKARQNGNSIGANIDAGTRKPGTS